MHQKEIDKTLLQMYFLGECNKEQLARVRQYLSNPEYKESLDAFLQSDWDHTMKGSHEPIANKETYERFLTIVSPAVKQEKKIRYMSLQKMWEVAAAVILIISVAGFAWLHKKNDQQPEQLVNIHNKAGRRTVFYLPDSSQVYLSAASSLEYNTGYGTVNRDLWLKGEAYFIVKHGREHSFNVTTGKIKTVDIGTEFNIRALQGQPTIEIAVAKGSVEVFDNDENKSERLTQLLGQQQLLFDTATRQVKINTLPSNELVGAWRDGLLVFRKQSLREVAEELQRFYGLTIHFSNNDHEKILITTTLRNASASEALEIIALTAGVKIKRTNNDVAIL